MKSKAKTKNTKSAKLADLKARKDPKGGAQKGQTNRGPMGQHNETFLAD
jgi:hypothetical protein